MGQRLLLVDSDRSFLKEHQVSLEAAFDLEVAGSPDGVAARLEGGAFAAALICVEVAENKGYALCSTIRKNPRLEGVKVALISAKATEEEYRRHQSLKGRADLYLHKPIAPSALVAALTPLVPGRVLDPDNPLGELVDTELGDDWLDGLKGALEGPPAAPAAAAPPAPSASPLDALPEVAPDSRHLKRLEDQVASLQEQVRERDRKLQAAEAEAQQVQRQLNSVTLNLDELERSNREADALKARLAETEAALRSLEDVRNRDGESVDLLKAQLKEALAERSDLIQQVEALNQQVGEKAQRAIELLKERDRLLHEVMDLEGYRTRSQELEGALAEKTAAHETAQAELEAARTELEGAHTAQEQLHATLEELVTKHTALEGVHQAALLELAGHKEKAHALQMEVTGLETTLRSQGRDLAEVGARAQQAETDLAAARSQVLERDQQLLERQESLQQREAEVAQLAGQLAEARQELDEARILHDGERLELMNGLDQKEAELARLAEALAAQQEAHAALEREKQAVHGQLAEHRDRLQGLDGLLQEIQDKLRRGSDLARG